MIHVRVTPFVVVEIGGREAVLTPAEARRLARRLLRPIAPLALDEPVAPGDRALALESAPPAARRVAR